MRKITGNVILFILTLCSVSCVFENDMSYPVIVAEFTSFDVEGDEWEESIDRTPDLVRMEDRPDLDAQAIIEKIKQAGIVGMGGATFPCHVKLCPPPGQKAECVIINAVECEPYLTSDHSLMLEKSDEMGRNLPNQIGFRLYICICLLLQFVQCRQFERRLRVSS